MAVELEENDAGFVLTNSDGQVITLTDIEMLSLAQSALRLRDRVVARQSREGANAVFVTPVLQVELNSDLLHAAIHLGLIVNEVEAPVWFSLPIPVAHALGIRLPELTAQIQGNQNDKTAH
jgi:hypothetical protein